VEKTPHQQLALSWNVPNALTLTRLCLAGIISWLLFMRWENGIKTAGILLIVAFITDLLDGPAARRLGQATLFGAIFDMSADFVLFVPSLLLSMRAGLFDRVNNLVPLNPYLYAVWATSGVVFTIIGILVFLWKRRTLAIAFPLPPRVAKFNFIFWMMPLIAAIFRIGPDWALAALMYVSMISGTTSTFSYFKKGWYIFTD
jgi:CDP-diacylglycerol---glycerol-3-phosphate 3-phosphatidyltransferase